MKTLFFIAGFWLVLSNFFALSQSAAYTDSEHAFNSHERNRHKHKILQQQQTAVSLKIKKKKKKKSGKKNFNFFFPFRTINLCYFTHTKK